jgi:ADP-heptose:LPS heptosyltransferase
MLATPMLAALSIEFPDTRFDWAIGDWARPAIAKNPRLTALISIGEGGIQRRSWAQIGQLVKRLRQEEYDTCFVPSRSGVLSYIAWQAGIRQRVGLLISGRGFAHTVAVSPTKDNRNAATRGLALARAAGVTEETIKSVGMEFYPADRDRLAVTQRLVEEIDWLGEVPLVIFHPGGGENPKRSTPIKRWPAERFARLGNHVKREYGAKIVLVGAEGERSLTRAIAGLMAAHVTDLSGQLSLGEIGAMCEVADLFVGNDSGPSHVAAASGCPTLVIYGPSDPAFSKPYMPKGNVVTVWRDLREVEEERPFTWDIGVTAGQVIEAADSLLERTAERQEGLEFLMGEGE